MYLVNKSKHSKNKKNNINKNLKHDILEYHEHKVRAENDSNVFLNKRFEVSLDCYNNELDKFKNFFTKSFNLDSYYIGIIIINVYL